MREKIYANYKKKKPYNLSIIYLFLSIGVFLFELISFFFYNKNISNIGFLAITFVFFYLFLEQRALYLRNKQTPIIYFNLDEIIVNSPRYLIIKLEDIESFKIKRKKYLDIFLKDEKWPISISLYHITYQKIDYVEDKLRLFINKN